MENLDNNIGKLITAETEKRLEKMSAADYVWPEKADRIDVIAVLAIVVICGILILGCMTGVIL